MGKADDGRLVITKDKAKLNVSFLFRFSSKIIAICYCLFTEFYFTGRTDIVKAEFDRMMMRQYLLNCLENMEIVPFPN